MGSSSEIRSRPPRRKGAVPATRAFTLVELLVVIGIIGILASVIVAFLIPKAQQSALHQATAEMRQMEAAIDSYHADFGAYPPDNQTVARTISIWGSPHTETLPPLFYELSGAPANQINGKPTGTYGSNQTYVATADYAGVFGLAGPQNSAPEGVRSYLKDLRPGQLKLVPGTQVYVLTCSLGTPASPTDPNLNPWCYNSSSPTNNPSGYDLYTTNILIGNKYYTIGNWNR